MFSIRNVHPEKIYSTFVAENRKAWLVAINIWRYLLKYFLKKKIYLNEEINWAEKTERICSNFLNAKDKDIGVSIGFTGDIMWVKNEDPSMVTPEVKERMRGCDYWIGNLETNIVSEKKVKSFWPDYLRYSSSSKIIRAFRNNNKSMFEILSVANNHIYDNGDPGIITTINSLEDEGILYSGLNNDFCIKEYKSIRIGFYALTYGTNLNCNKSAFIVNKLEYSKDCMEKVNEVIRKMDEAGADLKILSLHWGHEFEFLPTILQRNMARELVIAGADIILGHHSHVIQPMEILFLGGYEKKMDIHVERGFCIKKGTERKALIMYSLGNFVTDMITRDCRQGAGVALKIFKKGKRADWQINDIFYLENIRSGFLKPHRTILSKDESASSSK